MEAKLVVVGGKAQAEEFTLKLPAIVGRSRSADVPLNHPLVSRQHCELFEADGRLMVRDLGSLNGTFVGDSRVTAEVLLTPGGHLTVGSVTFEAVYDAAPGDADEAPDFSLSDDAADVDQTVETSGVKPAAATAEEPSPEESSAEGFDMSWLNEGEEEAAAPASASAEEAAESPQDLEPPLDLDDAEQTIQKKPPEPRRAAKAKEEAKRGAAKPKPEAKPTPQTSAAAAASPAEEVPTEFAPAEGGAHEAGGDEDMDDFFRSLTAE